MIVSVACAQIAAASAAAGARRDTPPDSPERIVVRSRRDDSAGGSTSLRVEVARETAAAQNDALRAVTSAPGVGRASFDGGAIILWGAAPNTSRVVVDGVPIPALLHASGIRGVVHDAFVSSIDVVPAGFGAPYGRATGGIVLLESRTAPFANRASVSADLIDASAVTAATRGEIDASAGIRGGYLRELVAATTGRAFDAFIAVPQTLDYQARVEGGGRTGMRWSVFTFGSLDRVSIAPEGDDPVRQRRSDRESTFHRIAVQFQSRDEADAHIDVTAWAGEDDRSRSDAVGSMETRLAHRAWLGGLRATYAIGLSPSVRFLAGIDAEGGVHDLARVGSLAQPAREGDPVVLGQTPPPFVRSDSWSVRTVGVAPWIGAAWSGARGAVRIEPSLRVDGTLVDASRALPPVGDTPARGTAHLVVALQPRITASVDVTRAITLRGSYGLYAMPPDPEDLSATFGNPRLDGSIAQHATLGGLARVMNVLRFAVTGFVRHVDGTAVRPATLTTAGAALENAGSSDGFGAQFVLQSTPWHGLSGWLAYTLSRTTVVDRVSPLGRLSDFDQTHLFQGVLHLALPRGFATGARVRVASGFPRTPVVGHGLDNVSGDAQPIFGAPNSDRLPLYVGVDLRVDWRVAIGRTVFACWLDLLNVTGQGSVEDVLYDPTYRERRYVTGIPFFADVGARVEF